MTFDLTQLLFLAERDIMYYRVNQATASIRSFHNMGKP